MLMLSVLSLFQTGHWVGTILLNTCELIERPSKKDGFCYKLFHPLDQSIWATKVRPFYLYNRAHTKTNDQKLKLSLSNLSKFCYK